MRARTEEERHNTKYKWTSTENGNNLSASDLQFIRFLVETGQPKDAFIKMAEWEMEQGLRDSIPEDRSAFRPSD